MNKLVAFALAACLFSAVTAQNATTTTNTTVKANTTTVVAGNGTAGSWCRANNDCIQSQNFCCASSKTGLLGYI